MLIKPFIIDSRPFSHNSFNFILKMPKHSRFFTVQAVRLWNDLPETIRKVKIFPTFKKVVRDHYLLL